MYNKIIDVSVQRKQQIPEPQTADEDSTKWQAKAATPSVSATQQSRSHTVSVKI